MTISGALYTSFYGLRNAEQRIGVVSENVTNADKPGYTRKELQSTYVTTNAGTVPIDGSIETANYNRFMLKTLVEDTSLANKNIVISDYMNLYGNELGTVDGDNSLSAYMNDFAAAIDKLTVTPEDTSLKNQVIAMADRVADELNRLSEQIQAERLKADQEIERTVSEVNKAAEKISLLNYQITEAETLGETSSNLIDDRNKAVEELSALIDIDYFIDSRNQMKIYTAGRPLVDSRAIPIEYEANTALDKNTLHPAGFNDIDLSGFDITSFVQGGELGGLIEVRDGFYVEEQAKLDEFADVLITQMNSLLNEGASIPGRTTVTGDVSGLTPATALGATGIIRIAVTDSSGVAQNILNLNLAGSATVADLLTNINGSLNPDVSASLTADGQLQLVANNAGEGIVFMQETSSFPSGENFSTFFGLNNMFTGSGADNIQVSDYLHENGAFLATGRGNDDGGFAVGDLAVSIGDSSLTQEIREVFSNVYSFDAAGNFAAQTQNLDQYIDQIVSDVAFRASNAEATSTITTSLMDQTRTALENLSGVNIDEELANLIDLEAKYEASATMIATLQEMFDTLLGAVR